MAERFFDPDFASRIVRLLNLKGGSAPDLVGTEIQITLDLSTLLAKAPDLLPSGIFDEVTLTAKAGIAYRGYFSAQSFAVGSIVVLQVLNPAGSGRIVVVRQHTNMDGAIGHCHRFYNTPLTTLHASSPALPSRPGSRASTTEIRRQLIVSAGVPPAGASNAWMYYTGSSLNPTDRLLNIPYVLGPGQGMISYPCVDMGTTEGQPIARDNIGQSSVITLYEFTEA